MKMVKSLILGSAAGLIAMSGAQAADLPVKAKAVEYVRICSLYGAGFYYIPGTDTCIKIGGYIHAEIQFNGQGVTNGPNWEGNGGQANRLRNYYQMRSRQDLNMDTRTATEYGVVRTFSDVTFTWTGGGSDAIAGGSLGVYHAFIQFAGFTLGRTISQFSSPWGPGPGNNTSYLIGGDDTNTGVNQIAYTASFGNGVTASISIEEQSKYRNSQLFNTATVAGGGVAGQSAATYLNGNGPFSIAGAGASGAFAGGPPGGFGGNTVPDIVGQLRVDQAWGLFQVSVAGHDIHASYYNPANETTGHPTDAYGFAVQGSLSIKNLPTGPGDSINIDAAFSNGATRYVLGGVSPNSFAMYGGTNIPGVYQSIGVATSTDGVFTTGGQIEKTNAYGIRGAFNHNWNPNWSSSIFGSYTVVDYSGAGAALFCAGFTANVAGGVGPAATYTCNPDFAIAQVGFRTVWTPVKNLSLSGEVLWMGLDQKFTGTTGAVTALATKPPAAAYEFKDQNTVVVGFRARRNF